MNIMQKQITLLVVFSASILTPTISLAEFDNLAETVMKCSDFRNKNPELVKEYDVARKAAENCPSYREYNTVGHTLKTHHLQLISRTKALKHVWSGSLPLHNVVWNKLSIDNFFDNCERTRWLDTPQCKLYNQLATEYSERHTQLLSQYNELQDIYFKSNECLNLEATTKKVETAYINQKKS